MATNSDESENVPIQGIVNLQIGERRFRVKKTLLMNKMKYFEAMFTIDMKEKHQSTVVLDPEIVQPEVFDKILDFIYIGGIDFTKVDIRALYRAADYLNFEELSRRIIMTSNMTSENVILRKQIAIEFNLEQLEQLFNQFIIDNISNIDRTQLIPLLSYYELVGILDKLRRFSREEKMFHYVVEWVNDLQNDRKKELAELIKNIPLQALSLTFLKDVVSQCELIRKDNKCFDLLFEAIISKPRGDVLYAIGGIDDKGLTSVSEYNPGKWTATTPMPGPRSIFFDCAVIDHKIYVCGGYNETGNMNEVKVFDTHTRTWSSLTPMNYARKRCSVAVLNEQIYVAGGSNETYRLSEVERYCLRTDRWSDVASMTTHRNGHELVALNGFLYAIGGNDGKNAGNSVERYDPRTDQWRRMNDMNYKYEEFGSAVLNGYIYIAGISTCEVYSPADDKWTEMPGLSKCEGGRRLAVYSGKLYAMGGTVGERKDFKGSKTVQVFDFQARVWRPQPDMDIARAFPGVVVVKH